MSPFKMQERDLDLFILEELHSDTGFSSWLAERLGLEGYVFEAAKHSVSAKVNGNWGETDVLLVLTKGTERIVVLIEDKICASFTDRQAARYHDRGKKLVAEGEANDYRILLVAPKSYLAGVPKDDPWDQQLAIDEIVAWFEQKQGSHASWRIAALNNCIAHVNNNLSAKEIDVKRFSEEFSSYLRENHPEFQHRSTADPWGLTISFEGRKPYTQIAWKINQSTVDLSFWDRHLGKLKGYSDQVGLIPHSAAKTDMLRVPVGTAVWSEPLSSQIEVVNEVIAACQRLRPIAIEIAALPSIIQEAPQLPRP